MADGRKIKRFQIADNVELVAQPALDVGRLIPFYQVRKDGKIVAIMQFLREGGEVVACSLDFYSGLAKVTNFASTFREAIAFLKAYNWSVLK